MTGGMNGAASFCRRPSFTQSARRVKSGWQLHLEEGTVAETVIDWDGSNVPRGLHLLAPGRYVVSPLGSDELTAYEDAAVREGLDEIEAGHGIPLDQVIREFEERLHQA